MSFSFISNEIDKFYYNKVLPIGAAVLNAWALYLLTKPFRSSNENSQSLSSEQMVQVVVLIGAVDAFLYYTRSYINKRVDINTAIEAKAAEKAAAEAEREAKAAVKKAAAKEAKIKKIKIKSQNQHEVVGQLMPKVVQTIARRAEAKADSTKAQEEKEAKVNKKTELTPTQSIEEKLKTKVGRLDLQNQLQSTNASGLFKRKLSPFSNKLPTPDELYTLGCR